MSSSFQQSDLFGLVQFGLPLLVIFGAAILIILLAAFYKNQNPILCPAISITALMLAFFLSWQNWLLNFNTDITFFIFDRYTFLVWLVIIFASVISVLLSISYLKAKKYFKPEYYALLLFAVFGMGCLIAGNDLLMFFLGLEVMAISLYALIGFLRHQALTAEATLKYFLMGIFASAFLLMGIAFLFGSGGSTNLQLLSERLPAIINSPDQYFCLFGMALLLIGFGFKLASVPFHFWAPDVYEGAPTPITTLLATAVKIASFAAFLKISIFIFQAAGVIWLQVISVLSVVTMLIGNIAAISQNNLKRMLAYSSIAHAGYLLVGFSTLARNPGEAAQAITFYFIAYVLMTAGAFTIITLMDLGEKDQLDIKYLAGLGKKRPILALSFSLFLLSLLGVPPTIGFFGKYYLFLTAMKSGLVWLVVAALINTAISAYYYLRPIVVMYFISEKETQDLAPLPMTMLIILTLVGLGVIYFGIFPTDLLAMIANSF
ncbi:MAG: NADH-quinone oxidoreductase subunit N [Pseudomonadota bacterium]